MHFRHIFAHSGTHHHAHDWHMHEKLNRMVHSVDFWMMLAIVVIFSTFVVLALMFGGDSGTTSPSTYGYYPWH